MTGPQKTAPDIISLIAAIGAPTFVALRLATGGWTTITFYLLVLVVVAAFYFLISSRGDRANSRDMKAGDSNPETDEQKPQKVGTTRTVMVAVAAAYVLILILFAFAGSLHPGTKM